MAISKNELNQLVCFINYPIFAARLNIHTGMV
jgi:hypothetical protein